MRYEWDEAKREANLAKHDVDFKAASNFLWPQSVTIPDRRKDYREKRFVSLAPIHGRLHVMVWTPRNEGIRIIGLRKANRREEMYYEEKT